MENQTIESIGIEANNLENSSAYEAPRVESVLTPEEMEREILYAGNNGTIFQ